MPRFTSGWIKLHREVLEKDISQNVYLFAIWNYLLLIAVYKPSQIIWRGKQRILVPGTCVFGTNELADRWGCSKSVIKKWLKYLEETQRISLESCPRGTIVTICNWELFQETIEEPCPLSIHSESTPSPLRVHREPLNEEGKKERRKEEELRYVSSNEKADDLEQQQHLFVIESHAVSNEPAQVSIPIPKRSKFSETTRHKMRDFIQAYASAYKEKYKSNPEGIKDKGIIGKLGHWIESVSKERSIQLAEVYIQISYRQIDDSYHSLWQFFNHLNRIGNALDTGKDANSYDWDKVFSGGSA